MLIEKLSRLEVAEKHEYIAKYISDIQNLFYSEQDLKSFNNKQEKKFYLSSFDLKGLHFPEIESNYKIFGIKYKDPLTVHKELAKKFVELFHIKEPHFFITNIFKENLTILRSRIEYWNGQSSGEIMLREKIKEYIRIINEGVYFDGILKIDISMFEEFLEFAVWFYHITNVGPDQGFIFFLENGKFTFHLCKYGNIHLTEYGEESITISKLQEKDWIYFETLDKETEQLDYTIINQLFNIN